MAASNGTAAIAPAAPPAAAAPPPPPPPPPATATPSLAPFTGATRLRALLSDPHTTVFAPGVYDGLTARLALAAGHTALYMTGAGTSLSRLGIADLGLVTQDVMVANAAMLASLDPATPLIADADTGYGGPLQVGRTVALYARAGVAALHLEDQVEMKRCGHLLGKELVAREVWWSKLRAAVRARDQVVGTEGMMIFARTDARQVSCVFPSGSLSVCGCVRGGRWAFRGESCAIILRELHRWSIYADVRVGRATASTRRSSGVAAPSRPASTASSSRPSSPGTRRARSLPRCARWKEPLAGGSPCC